VYRFLSTSKTYTAVPFFRNNRNAEGDEECKVRRPLSGHAVFELTLSRAGSTHRAWQELPRHLRRRAASHHVRRVPLRLRNKSRTEVRSDSVNHTYAWAYHYSKMDSLRRKILGRSLPKRGKDRRELRSDVLSRRQSELCLLETLGSVSSI
jgi:hypothetical protein